ncbi:hypothetical protein GCL60_16570 [Silvanigrella paludirubra]|uniref:Dit-like phage tail protein N-terminal domain-containing protein n=1 Tax=Silvanigrella paludirubra TaxID=2499159 RepID=A0A6N6VMR6_9BACT|nr:hypothetical protein [Silvanigrella paludirubra]KAB8035843.1 hypothetical protein GCL60_16570 [Silvanigrella paludirubra]
MGLLSFFQNGKSCLAFDDLEIDVSLSETHTYESDITKNPVEKGSPICDNIVHKQPKVSIKGLCSPLKIEYLGGIKAMSAQSFVQNKWQQLLKLKLSGEKITLFTGLDIYPDMIMTTLNKTRDSSNVNHLEFTANFERIKIVPVEYTSMKINIPKSASKTKVNSANKTNAGLQDKKPVDNSYLDAGLKWFGF